jgi:hypothetical protein
MDPDPWKKNHADHADPVSDSQHCFPESGSMSFARTLASNGKSFLIHNKYLFLLFYYGQFFYCRQGAAQALADCVRAYGAEFLDPLIADIRNGLTALSQSMPATSPSSCQQEKKQK